MLNSKFYFSRKVVSNVIKLNFIKFRIGDSLSYSKVQGIIPNVVFQTTRSKWIPVRFWVDVKKFRRSNPDFTFLTFNQRTMTKWMNENYRSTVILSAFENSALGVMQSDIFKYCYAYKNGGISLDSTKYLSKKLRLVFENNSDRLILSQESHLTDIEGIVDKLKKLNLQQSLIINWCFAVAPHHPAIKCVIELIEENYTRNKGVNFKDVKHGVWQMTGPLAFNFGILRHFTETLGLETRIDGIDFNESVWPKFQSSSLVNMFSKHYIELDNLVLFK